MRELQLREEVVTLLMKLPKNIGLVAGNGDFPLHFVRSALKKGHCVHTACHLHETQSVVSEESTSSLWIKLGHLNKIIAYFKECGVSHMAVLGGISRKNLLLKIRPDLLTLRVLFRAGSLRDMALFNVLLDEFTTRGITIFDPRLVLDDFSSEPGVLTKRSPSEYELRCSEIGWRAAKEAGKRDLGQTVIVVNEEVSVVEGADGTDAAIARVRVLRSESDISEREKRKSGIVVKVKKPAQDVRIDLPAIGVNTIESMIKSGCSALFLEEDGVLFLDQSEVIKRADQNSISIVILSANR